MTQGVNGWICDECVLQKRSRLRVSVSENFGENYWHEDNQKNLDECADTKFILDKDFFGRKENSLSEIHPSLSNVYGWRLYDSITSEERCLIECCLLQQEAAIDADLVVKLLKSLMEAEADVAKARARQREAEINALDRARHQAERLSAEELAKLRVREAKNLSKEEIGKLWEHQEWYENEICKLERKIQLQKDRISELEQTVSAFKDRFFRD